MVNNVSLAGFHSKETEIHGNDMVHKTDYHREKNHGTLQSVAEQFT
jgi:hypothetical protein